MLVVVVLQGTHLIARIADIQHSHWQRLTNRNTLIPRIHSFSVFGTCKLHLPYFNLADGSKSTDASLVVEVILRQDRGQTCLPPIGSEDQPRSLLEAAGDLEGKHDSRSASILAVGDLDVQTLLTGSRNGSALETSGTAVVPLTLRKCITAVISPPSPESVAVRVGLRFSKTPTDERIKGERRVPECVPTLFAVATTLFDCATVIKEAELRLYARCANTGDVTLLSSDDRGAIGKLRLNTGTRK